MPPTVIGLTQGWNFYAQRTDGTKLRPATTEKIVFAGTLFTDTILTYNDSTHVANAATNAHTCATVHVNNTKFLTSTTASINGAASSALPIPTNKCAFFLEFLTLEKVLVTAAKIYVYSGTDSNPAPNVSFYAAQGGVSTSWKDVNALSNALALTLTGTPDVEQDFYVALSMSPLGAGVQGGTLKLTATYA